MPIIDKFREKGIVVMGKVESGTVCEGDSLLIMPNKVSFCSFFFFFFFFSSPID
jgi:translation elongation factor EF-1alpha